MPRKMLEAALKTADPLTICAAMDALVRMSPNVSKLAKDAASRAGASIRQSKNCSSVAEVSRGLRRKLRRT